MTGMYESPINIIFGNMRTELEGTVFEAIQEVHVDVDRDELIKALQYDRRQYERGYSDGYSVGAKDALEKFKSELMKRFDHDLMYGWDGDGDG